MRKNKSESAFPGVRLRSVVDEVESPFPGVRLITTPEASPQTKKKPSMEENKKPTQENIGTTVSPRNGESSFPGIPCHIVHTSFSTPEMKPPKLSSKKKKDTDGNEISPIQEIPTPKRKLRKNSSLSSAALELRHRGKDGEGEAEYTGYSRAVTALDLDNNPQKVNVARMALEELLSAEAKIEQRIRRLEDRERELLEREKAILDGIHSLKTFRKASATSQKKPLKRSSFMFPQMNSRGADIEVCELLGVGGSGARVYSVLVDGWLCAMKEMQVCTSNEKDMQAFEKEMALYYALPRHRNLVRFLFHEQDKNSLRLYMTKYSGTVKQLIQERINKGVEISSVSEAIGLAFNVAKGLSVLHENNVIHRDVKAANVFYRFDKLGRLSTVALGDMDAASVVGVSVRPNSVIGTPGYMAPEMIVGGESQYTVLADIYSYGMFLYEIMTGRIPYDDIPIMEMFQKIQDEERPVIYQEEKGKHRTLYDIFYICTHKDPTKRPSAKYLVNILKSLTESQAYVMAELSWNHEDDLNAMNNLDDSGTLPESPKTAEEEPLDERDGKYLEDIPSGDEEYDRLMEELISGGSGSREPSRECSRESSVHDDNTFL